MGDALVIDIGNTSTSIGLFSEGAVKAVTRIESTVRKPKQIARAIDQLPQGTTVQQVFGATVVPKAKKAWNLALRKHLGMKPYWITHQSDLGIPVTYPDPSSIGPDRLANAAAAAELFGRPVIVADFGTALTFDIVSVRGGYAGGIIAPGLPLMFSYLAEKTALLPHIEPAPVRGIVGKSTEDAMRIGARYGYRGMVREILDQLHTRLRAKDLKVCATGGYAAWVLKGMNYDIAVRPDLTLFGIGWVGALNRPIQ